MRAEWFYSHSNLQMMITVYFVNLLTSWCNRFWGFFSRPLLILKGSRRRVWILDSGSATFSLRGRPWLGQQPQSQPRWVGEGCFPLRVLSAPDTLPSVSSSALLWLVYFKEATCWSRCWGNNRKSETWMKFARDVWQLLSVVALLSDFLTTSSFLN